MTTSATRGTLYRRFRDTAHESVRSPALTFLRPDGGDPRTYTYEQLFERVENLAAGLRRLGLDRSGPLGILLSTQEEQTLHYLAALCADLVPAILTPPNRKLNREYYLTTMEAVLRRCRFTAVVTDVEDIHLPTRGYAPGTLSELSTQRPAPPHSLEVAGELADASFLQFSSGTTGIKRGVLVRDDAVLCQLDTYAEALALTAEDCIISWLPLYHDMGFIACLNMPLAHGVHTVMLDPIEWVSDPASYVRTTSQYRGTLSWHPNFAFSFMAHRIRDVDVADSDLSSLRGLVNCSEPVTHESQQAFHERFEAAGLSGDVFKGCYAMAETTFALTHGLPSDPHYLDWQGPVDGAAIDRSGPHVSVGRALPGVELAVVDPDSQDPVPERRVGEIWVRSPFNFTGYFNEPEATKRAFVGDWYRTGDLGYRVGEAYYVAGRLKDVLIVGGVNVFPQDLEELATTVDSVAPGRVTAFSTFDKRIQSERIVVLAESETEQPDDSRAATIEIRQRLLAAFQIANFHVEVVPPGWLVKSSSGKMARAANRRKWLSQQT